MGLSEAEHHAERYVEGAKGGRASEYYSMAKLCNQLRNANSISNSRLMTCRARSKRSRGMSSDILQFVDMCIWSRIAWTMRCGIFRK